MNRPVITWQIGEIIEETVKGQTDADKIAILKRHDNKVLRYYLELTFKKWALKAEPIEYKKNKNEIKGEAETDLYFNRKKMYLFLTPDCGGHPNLLPYKREMLYKDILNYLSSTEAECLEAIRLGRLMDVYGLSDSVIKQFLGITESVVVVEEVVCNEEVVEEAAKAEVPKKRGRKKKVSE